MSQHAPLVIDLSGPAITDDDRRRVQHPLVGGVIHFARHFQSRAQITAVSPEEHELTGVVAALTETTATVDFNHPLAGEALHFQVTIVDVQ